MSALLAMRQALLDEKRVGKKHFERYQEKVQVGGDLGENGREVACSGGFTATPIHPAKKRW